MYPLAIPANFIFDLFDPESLPHVGSADIAITLSRCVCEWVGVYVSTIKRKSDCSDLKLGVVVVLETMSKRIDFGFKMSRVWVRGQHFELLSPATTYRIKLITFFYTITKITLIILNCNICRRPKYNFVCSQSVSQIRVAFAAVATASIANDLMPEKTYRSKTCRCRKRCDQARWF